MESHRDTQARPYTTGGEFLLAEARPEDVFTPEDFTPEQLMIGQAVDEFVRRHLEPVLPQLEYEAKIELGAGLLREAGKLGLLAVGVPEAYGGLGADVATVMLVSERMAPGGSFNVTYGAHSGIGTLPILHFGSEEQKRAWLPRLATAEIISAYALTEPGSGSDALAAATTAVLSPDGAHWVLNGTKQYISNAAFADLFILFAKVDGEKFTAFIVERDTPGLEIGSEEKKMGIRGSSTCQVVLQDARVPAANVLGEIGRGHVIAFDILNVGRFKLGASTTGGAKAVFEMVVPYVLQRRQFGRALAEFPLIRAKLADVAVRTFMSESMVYRTAGLIDRALATLDPADPERDRRAIGVIAEFSIECSLIKVYATEALALAAEEGVQMLGGYGYVQDYPLERVYRDERVNRIFEGTNEINRLLISGMVLRRAAAGELPFFKAARQVADELTSLRPAGGGAGEKGDEFLAEEARLTAGIKKACLAALGLAAQKHRDAIKERQEILSDAADMIMEAFACESALLRARKRAAAAGPEAAAAMADMTTLYVHDAVERVGTWGRQVLAQIAAGDELRTSIAGLRRLTNHLPVDRAALHDRIARRVLEAGAYAV